MVPDNNLESMELFLLMDGKIPKVELFLTKMILKMSKRLLLLYTIEMVILYSMKQEEPIYLVQFQWIFLLIQVLGSLLT